MDQEQANKDKRRSLNWDSSEVALLRKLVEFCLSIIRDKQTNILSNKMKMDAWRSITMEINTVGLHERTVSEVKIKGQSIQAKAKRSFAETQTQRNTWWSTTEEIRFG